MVTTFPTDELQMSAAVVPGAAAYPPANLLQLLPFPPCAKLRCSGAPSIPLPAWLVVLFAIGGQQGWKAATLYEVKLWPLDARQQPRSEQPPQDKGLTVSMKKKSPVKADPADRTFLIFIMLAFFNGFCYFDCGTSA